MQLTSQSLKCHWISVPRKNENYHCELTQMWEVLELCCQLDNTLTRKTKTRGSTVSLAMHEYSWSRLDALLPALCNSLGAWRKMLSILLHALPKTSSVVMPSSTVWLHPLLCWVLWDWWCRKPNETHHELDMVVGLCPPEAPGTVYRPVASLRWWLLSTLAWQDTS